jgi:hypothetical protein
MRGTILSAVLLAAAAAAGGCYTSADVGYTANANVGVSGDAYAATPDLVEVSPGVQVVADYDEPVFYTDGFYWRYYNNGWYRSNNYSTGWFYYDRPPGAVLRIDRPYAYAHYRPAGYVARNRARPYRPAEPIRREENRGGVRNDTVVRDHREPVRNDTVVRDHREQAQPVHNDTVVRDHRTAPPPKKEVEERDHRH